MMLREADYIELMCEEVGVPDAPAGPGDDAALSGERVTTVDLMVEDVHFMRAHPPLWLGHKLLAVNVSDMGAMGAVPKEFVLSAALPNDTPAAWWKALSRGIGRLARQIGAVLVGGDVTRSPGPVMLGVTLSGHLTSAKALLRSGGRPGDLVMLHSPQGIGRSSLGLSEWMSTSPQGWGGDPLSSPSPCLMAHLRPETSWSQGPWALRSGAHAGMDCSDGLFADVPRLAAQSALRIIMDLALLPEDPTLKGMESSERAAGGEDYGLLLLVPPEKEALFLAQGYVTLGRTEHGVGVAWTYEGQALTSSEPSFKHFEAP